MRAWTVVLLLVIQGGRAADWDNFADTWTATDKLGRTLPQFEQVGGRRPNRTVGIFYFLWLGPHSQKGGPWDISKILAADPGAMEKPDSPLWGPMFAPHHWGESIFGYYNSDDPYVLRKHAQMLSDAGVDVVIFDVTNQLTYKAQYQALLRAWSEVRALGNKTPQVAFLTPFWEPAKVVHELYRDLYKPGLHPDLWFNWEGKPLILADPDRLETTGRAASRNYPAELTLGSTLGQTFVATNSFVGAGGSFPTWMARDSGMTLTLRTNDTGGGIIASQSFSNVADNGWVLLRFPPQAAGRYYLQMSDPKGRIGWWSHDSDQFAGGEAFINGSVVSGDRNIQVLYSESEAARLREFFTFRRPQPDYFAGQTAADMWSWLEVYPQQIFTNSVGDKEQMSVGVAQNAVSNRLGSLSEPGARGRSYRSGRTEQGTSAANWGFNFAEQFEHALRQDPRFIFITGWNEWIAGRHPEFAGIRLPVMFVDQFDQEHSRDIEPMRGGHGDNYYYQMAGFIRRYKGVRRPVTASAPKTIILEEGFGQWEDVLPEYRDDSGDTIHRNFPGYASHTNYVNTTGRNDIIAAKATADRKNVYFYVRTRAPLSPSSEANWMRLLIDADADPKTGWEGYDLIVNRVPPENGRAVVERSAGAWNWEREGMVRQQVGEHELSLAIPRRMMPADSSQTLSFHFKWADNAPDNGDLLSWLGAGDTAPNGRFSYQFEQQQF